MDQNDKPGGWGKVGGGARTAEEWRQQASPERQAFNEKIREMAAKLTGKEPSRDRNRDDKGRGR